MNKLYTAQEVADRLKIKKTTVYELIKRGELESSKIGKQLSILTEAVPAIPKAGRIFHTFLLILNLRALC